LCVRRHAAGVPVGTEPSPWEGSHSSLVQSHETALDAGTRTGVSGSSHPDDGRGRRMPSAGS
jgi:hypothetical protein